MMYKQIARSPLVLRRTSRLSSHRKADAADPIGNPLKALQTASRISRCRGSSRRERMDTCQSGSAAVVGKSTYAQPKEPESGEASQPRHKRRKPQRPSRQTLSSVRRPGNYGARTPHAQPNQPARQRRNSQSRWTYRTRRNHSSPLRRNVQSLQQRHARLSPDASQLSPPHTASTRSTRGRHPRIPAPEASPAKGNDHTRYRV